MKNFDDKNIKWKVLLLQNKMQQHFKILQYNSTVL